MSNSSLGTDLSLWMARLMEAITPSLQSELEKIRSESRADLAEEYEKRFQDKLAEAAAGAQSRMEALREQVRTELAGEFESAQRASLTAELQSRFDEEMRVKSDELRTLMDAAANWGHERDEWARERSDLTDRVEHSDVQSRLWRGVAESIIGFDDAVSQTDLLLRFMKATQALAPTLGIYLAKGNDGLSLWKSRGPLEAFPAMLSEQTADPDNTFQPISVRGKLVAAVYASPPVEAEALELLVRGVQRSIEAYGMRLRLAPVSA